MHWKVLTYSSFSSHLMRMKHSSWGQTALVLQGERRQQGGGVSCGDTQPIYITEL